VGARVIDLAEIERMMMVSLSSRWPARTRPRSRDKALAPELNAFSASFSCPTRFARRRSNRGDGMGALDRFPGGMLSLAQAPPSHADATDGGGKKRISAPCNAVRRAASGYHWSQQISTPILP